jgi:hypothetical protein
VNAFTLSINADPPLRVTNTATASNADGGKLDAALARVLDVTIKDTATVTVNGTVVVPPAGGNRRLMVNDSSGLLEVVLDTLAGFRGAAIAADTVGARLDIVGVLLPMGSGSWRLKPRGTIDVTKH